MWSLGIVLAEVLVEDGLHLVDGPSAAAARRLGKPRILGAPGDHNIYDRHAFLCRRDDDASRAASADRAGFGFCANAETRRACRPRPRGVAGTTP